MVRDAPWRKLGGNVVIIIMLLLVSIIIYYYMNAFITLHQCTFNLLFAIFIYTVLKNIPAKALSDFHNIWQKYY